jgi:hypothetical protein
MYVYRDETVAHVTTGLAFFYNPGVRTGRSKVVNGQCTTVQAPLYRMAPRRSSSVPLGFPWRREHGHQRISQRSPAQSSRLHAAALCARPSKEVAADARTS